MTWKCVRPPGTLWDWSEIAFHLDAAELNPSSPLAKGLVWWSRCQRLRLTLQAALTQ